MWSCSMVLLDKTTRFWHGVGGELADFGEPVWPFASEVCAWACAGEEPNNGASGGMRSSGSVPAMVTCETQRDRRN